MSLVLSTFHGAQQGKSCTCSHASTIAFICFLGRPPDTTVGSYQWSLLGKVFHPIYITCDVTEKCGSIQQYNYSTIDTLEGTEVPLFINIMMYCIPRMWRQLASQLFSHCNSPMPTVCEISQLVNQLRIQLCSSLHSLAVFHFLMFSIFKFCRCRAFFEATGKAAIVSFPDRGRSTGWSIYDRSHAIRRCAFAGAQHLYVYFVILKLYWQWRCLPTFYTATIFSSCYYIHIHNHYYSSASRDLHELSYQFRQAKTKMETVPTQSVLNLLQSGPELVHSRGLRTSDTQRNVRGQGTEMSPLVSTCFHAFSKCPKSIETSGDISVF